MKLLKKYDLICSLGGNCAAAHNLLYKGLRHYSLPFDWCYMKNDRAIEYLCDGFQNNFKDFLLKENLVPLTGDEYNNSHTDRAQYKDIYTGYYFVNHFSKDASFDEDYEIVYAKIKRRLNRLLNKIISGKNILFVLTTSFYIDIEKIEKLKYVLQYLYPDKNIDFYIMFFNQRENKIVKNNNITTRYCKRAENINDYNKTNREWNFLDKIIIKSSISSVSVLIPAYNHEKYVQETIKSIIHQTYQNIELIIVDDGSKDSTWHKIQEMKEECEKRFSRVIFETKENEGTCKTLNKLLSLAQGEYIYLIASDDLAKPQAVETEVKFLSKHKDYALVVGDNEIIDSNSQVCYWDEDRNNVYNINESKYKTFGDFLKQYKKDVNFYSKQFGNYKTLYIAGNYIPNGYLIRKSIFDKIGFFTQEAPLEDHWLMLQISKYSKMKYIDEVLFSYRWHDSNTIKNHEKMIAYDNKTLEYEKRLVKSLKSTKYIDPIVFEIHHYGLCYKKQGIPYIFEILSYRKEAKKTKIFKVFGICLSFTRKI